MFITCQKQNEPREFLHSEKIKRFSIRKLEHQEGNNFEGKSVQLAAKIAIFQSLFVVLHLTQFLH